MPPDSRDYAPRTLIDEKFSGRKEDWEDWSRIYLDAAGEKGDDDDSWESTYLGTDRQVGRGESEFREIF